MTNFFLGGGGWGGGVGCSIVFLIMRSSCDCQRPVVWGGEDRILNDISKIVELNNY